MTNPYRAMCAELIEAVLSDDSHIDCVQIARRARALLAQPVAEGPTEEELRRVFVTNGAWPGGLRAVADLAADRARHGRPTPQPPAAGEVAELVEWLRTTGKLLHPDYSKSQIPYMRAAELLERPTPQPVPTSERLPEPEDCDEQGRCWWLKQRANPDHDLLMPTWHLQRQGPAGTTFFRFTHWLPANALPTPEATND